MTTKIKIGAVGILAAFMITGAAYAFDCASACGAFCSMMFPDNAADMSACYGACTVSCFEYS